MTKMEKKLTTEEMDLVAGGTLAELNDLAKAYCRKGGMFGKIVADAYSKVDGKSGLVGPVNFLLKKAVGDALSELGIKSDMSVGFLGTGGGSDPNKYWYKGNRIAHAEVLKIVENAPVG